MRFSILYMAATLLTFSASAQATVFSFTTDPFEGSTALTTPGRQVVGGEDLITFSTVSDVFAFDAGLFGVANQVHFVNGDVGGLPTSGVNVIVLETTDDDNNPVTLFTASNAANVIASQITTPGAGFFIYFNSGLNLPRLMYSRDLSDNTADLAVLARMTNLGVIALPAFDADNFSMAAASAIPEPSSLLVIMGIGAAWAASRSVRRAQRRSLLPDSASFC